MWAQRLSSVKEPLAGWQPWPKSLVTVKLGYIFTGWNAFGTLSWCTLGSTSSADGVWLAFQEEKQSHYGLIRGKLRSLRAWLSPACSGDRLLVFRQFRYPAKIRGWGHVCLTVGVSSAHVYKRWSRGGETAWGAQQGWSTCMSYTSYVRCCLTCAAAAFPAACLRSRRSAPIDWICIKMKDNETHQSTFASGGSGQRIRGLQKWVLSLILSPHAHRIEGCTGNWCLTLKEARIKVLLLPSGCINLIFSTHYAY